jgi:hypothetical protein
MLRIVNLLLNLAFNALSIHQMKLDFSSFSQSEAPLGLQFHFFEKEKEVCKLN